MDRQLSILIVDDDPVISTLVSHSLIKAGYQVEQARSAADALKRLSNVSLPGFTIVISDVHMPGDSGIKLLQDTRALGLDVPFFFMSGDAVLSEDEQIRSGSLGFMHKPFSPERLVLKIILTINSYIAA
jgi:DNA-binding NtrC family response regulator